MNSPPPSPVGLDPCAAHQGITGSGNHDGAIAIERELYDPDRSVVQVAKSRDQITAHIGPALRRPVIIKVTKPDMTDPQRIYDPAGFYFQLKPGVCSGGCWGCAAQYQPRLHGSRTGLGRL
jgi:hypothetical protein